MLGDVFWIVFAIAVCVGMLWLANRIEPHWTSKDGRRFLTTAQIIDRHGQTIERRREVRVTVAPDGTLHLSRRGVMRRDRNQLFEVGGKSPQPPRGRAVFVLDAIPADGTGNRLLLRLPARSPAVAVLDGVLDDAS